MQCREIELAALPVAGQVVAFNTHGGPRFLVSLAGSPGAPGGEIAQQAGELLALPVGGPLLFRQACLLGLEGIVSTHQDRAYKAGPSRHWINVKNPKSPAIERAKDAF
jgi:hypothetical protein